MESQKYNWDIILKISMPISAFVGYIYYTSNGRVLKGIVLFSACILAGFITYKKDKRKSNVFTSAALVVLVAVTATALKKFIANF